MAKTGSAIGTMFEVLSVIVVGYLALRFMPTFLSGLSTSIAGVNGANANAQGNGTNPFAIGYNSKTGLTASTSGNATTLLTSLFGLLGGKGAASAPLPVMVPPGGNSSLVNQGNSLGQELLDMIHSHNPFTSMMGLAASSNNQALSDASLGFNGGAADPSLNGFGVNGSQPSATQQFDTSGLNQNISTPSTPIYDPTSFDPTSGLDLSQFNSGSGGFGGGGFDPTGGSTSFDGGGYSFG